MKKSLVVLLTLVFIMGIAGTAFAANAFSDVPAGHWAYSAVNKLAAAGIIDGMGDGTFKGDKTLTRYEMATFVARAMTKEEKVTAEQRALIEKLANEFAGELQGLGVRVQRLEENANKIIINGNARLRYDAQDKSDDCDGKNINLDIFATYNVGDGWAVKTESEWKRKIDNPYTSSDDETMMSSQCEQLYITSGKHFSVGKQTYAPGYGLVFNSKIQGLQYVTGNDKLTATVNWGHTSSTAEVGSSQDLKMFDVVYALNSKTNIRADFERVADGSDYDKYYGIGGDIKFGKLLAIAAASKADLAADSNYDAKAYMAKLQYNAADLKVKHSSDVFVAYNKIPENNIIDRDDAEGYDTDFKGAKVGFHYVPMKNTLVTVWYMTGEYVSAPDTDKKILRAQAEFFF